MENLLIHLSNKTVQKKKSTFIIVKMKLHELIMIEYYHGTSCDSIGKKFKYLNSNQKIMFANIPCLIVKKTLFENWIRFLKKKN